MTLQDSLPLLPMLILLVGGVVLLLLESFYVEVARKHSGKIGLATFSLAFISALPMAESKNTLLTAWLAFDRLSHFSSLFILSIGIGINLLSYPLFKKHPISRSEYEFFMIIASIGLLLIASSADFLTLFLGIEILSIASYILTGYIRNWNTSSEASLKYFFLGAIGAAFLVYGIALLYGALGTTRFEGLLNAYNALAAGQSLTLFWGGMVFITAGFGFKAALFPLQFWAPDAYEGAPTPVTAFMSVGVKTGAFLAFARVFFYALPEFSDLWSEGVGCIAVASLLYANLLALRQFNLKRFFAYSGISHSGFLLIALAAQGPQALSALLFYLVVYALATLAAFSVLALHDKGEQGIQMEDLKGMARSSPFSAGILIFALLTLAGIPPTPGFFAKLFLFQSAMQAGYYALVLIALLTTVLAFYYYLRIAAYLFATSTKPAEEPLYSRRVLALMSLTSFGLLLLIIYPDSLLKFFT
jgi:NADH-quinone oxidoreductase subunit N